MDYFRDPGYEYPPEPEICFSKYKRRGDDDVENSDDDDDDDFDDIHSDNKNSNKTNGRNVEKGATFNIDTGKLVSIFIDESMEIILEILYQK